MKENTKAVSPEMREKTIVRTGIIGIAANILLVGFKAFVGLTANSVAVISDALNNLSDALSSLITIIGTKLAGKKPDKKHPLGYGRIEYMSELVVSAIVLYAGVTALVDSVKKIIAPEAPEHTFVSLIILGVAVAVKIVLGIYTKSKGKAVNSGSLTASGEDALNDAILSSSVLITAIIYMIFNINLEAWVGAIIALFIIKAGLGMISGAVSEMLGARADPELTKEIRSIILEQPQVHGVYDIVVNNYGPDKNIASLHVEVDDTMTAADIDALSRRIQTSVYSRLAVIISAVGLYSVNTTDDAAAHMDAEIRKLVLSHDGVLQMHGFYADTAEKIISFDVVLDFAVDDRQKLFGEIKSAVMSAYPDYKVNMVLDVDTSD